LKFSVVLKSFSLKSSIKELELEDFEKNGVLDETRYQGALKKENYEKNRYYSVLARMSYVFFSLRECVYTTSSQKIRFHLPRYTHTSY
jgi:hypothetical protein